MAKLNNWTTFNKNCLFSGTEIRTWVPWHVQRQRWAPRRCRVWRAATDGPSVGGTSETTFERACVIQPRSHRHITIASSNNIALETLPPPLYAIQKKTLSFFSHVRHATDDFPISLPPKCLPRPPTDMCLGMTLSRA